jgi:hypothetical protein
MMEWAYCTCIGYRTYCKKAKIILLKCRTIITRTFGYSLFQVQYKFKMLLKINRRFFGQFLSSNKGGVRN